ERNPKPGVYFNRLGELCDSRRKQELAAICYRAAIELMPQLPESRTNLGLLAMRTGRIDEAEKLLDKAFQADPFHLRVSNLRKVLGVLKGYDTFRTEHFVLRVDASDRMLAEYMADYLEEVHGELSDFFGFTPPTPTQVEIYSSAQGQTAHEWFSARMIGLPWIQTIGASTGTIVAMASPQAVDEPYHWGRVLRHEYSHILTLQQTNFEVPHWYTEALAVRAEGTVLTAEWMKLLETRVHQGELFTLRTIDSGFRQPASGDDWTMAYCQSWLYARFIEERWGAGKLLELLDAYRRGLTTGPAIEAALATSEAEFERSFASYLTELAAEIGRCRTTLDIEPAKALAEYTGSPRDATLAGRCAYVQQQAGNAEEARRIAEAGLQLRPGEPLCTTVLAAQLDDAGEVERADALLAKAYDP
ncbi:MAG: tetratricopeptide repeat protein, partial [Planctomycetaceae bacterium]|nr:tetratricopeptide repeat protein [Planctomycetaceae bacterium]